MDTIVIGYGPVGRDVTARLRARGDVVRVAQRHRPRDLPEGVPFRPCDLLDPASLRSAVAGATQIVLTAGFAYDGKVWARSWPTAIDTLAAAAAGARIVFVDNLYMYGPQDAPLREDMQLSSVGRKPAARTAATRRWERAAAQGVRFAALRAPDFYGPGVSLSHLGQQAIGALARGKPATLLVSPDQPHDFAYVPDIGRAVLSLLDADDTAYGQAWHVPCASTSTPRAILELMAARLGAKPRIRAVPMGLLPWLGLAVPFLRELAEMRFQWDRPYRVDASKFARAFWGDATPLAVGAAATAEAAAAEARAERAPSQATARRAA